MFREVTFINDGIVLEKGILKETYDDKKTIACAYR